MFQHIIAISSSYRLGKRIAWHYADAEISQEVLRDLSEKTKTLLGRPDYSIHKLSTDSKEWESVVNKDSFFADFLIYDELDDFLAEIADDKKISALDIAKLVLSIKPMSNLKLQKMIYLIYADYLLSTKKRLFNDKIIAWKYGPVIPEVYEYYKIHGREEIEEESDSQVVMLDEITIPVTLAKILQADDDVAILESVKSTFEKFGDKTASQLVSITHKSGSPWDRTIQQHVDEITDDTIREYHHIEIA
jgi:uncharacterized phage-associated protein